MKTAQIQATLIDCMGSDLSVVNAARVSFEKESEWVAADGCDDDGWPTLIELSDKDTKLINYLAKHKHTSPFNHCFASFRAKAPIFVARQLVKHKFLPWNEVSRRYVDSEPEFFLPKDWRAKAENVKQGSGDSLDDNEYLSGFCYTTTKDALAAYNVLLVNGVCPEQARMVLPQNTMTEWIWSGSLGAWADMCRLRLDPHAQQETREVAEKISAIMAENYPVSWAALLEG